MAKVLLTCTAPRPSYARDDFHRVRRSAQGDPYGIHTRTEDPDEADLVLFVGAGEPDFADVRGHPLVRRHREKCFLFDASERILPYLPGVYATLERWAWAPGRTRAGFFPAVGENPFLRHGPGGDAPLLFSFVGAVSTSPVRKALLGLGHPRGLVRDTSGEKAAKNVDWMHGYRRETAAPYARSIRESRFVLCPRGASCSSLRLFEAMRLGRAPVVISDAWVPPTGPRWSSFAIRVAERQVAAIPHLLESREADWAGMGARARQAWECWFSARAAYHRIVEWCLEILADRRAPEARARWTVYLQALRPYFLRRHLASRLLARLRRDGIRAADHEPRHG